MNWYLLSCRPDFSAHSIDLGEGEAWMNRSGSKRSGSFALANDMEHKQLGAPEYGSLFLARPSLPLHLNILTYLNIF